jgi:hypothetical protein
MNAIYSFSNVRPGLIAIAAISLTACFELPEEKFDVQIHWLPVTEFSDGSAITSIDHYQIHYGQETDHFDNIIMSRSPNITSYIISDLETGEYYFAMVAVADNGEESEMSQSYYFQVND